MTAESVAITRTWRVGKRKVTMMASRPQNDRVIIATMEWFPTMPHKLSRREWKQYRTGRDAAFAELCRDLGIEGLLCEI